jgi:hypothetical protein
MHKFFFKNEPPTFTSLLMLIDSDPKLPNFKRRMLYKLSLEFGFQLLKRNETNVIMY